MIMKNHASVPIRKERLSPTSKARRQASRNEFVEKGGMPDRVKSFGEVDRGENRPRARPEFVKTQQQQKGKKTSILLKKDSESRSKRKSHPNELSKI